MSAGVDFELEGPSGNPGMRFLVIDDSVTMRRIISNILGRLGYPEVVHASNGREALDRLATESIDIVITDWYTPDRTALDFVKALRTSPATRDIPSVVVTANAASDDIQHALELGVNGYILKPFTAETMRDKIGALLMQTSSNAPAAPASAPSEAELGSPVLEKAVASIAVEQAAAPVEASAEPIASAEDDSAESEDVPGQPAETAAAVA